MYIEITKQINYYVEIHTSTLKYHCIYVFNCIVPGVISDIAVIGGYVTWQRPVAPNGIIVNYNLRVLAANQTSNTIWLNASSFFYQVQSSDIPPLSDGNDYVQVSVLRFMV